MAKKRSEEAFQRQYKKIAAAQGLDPDPDNPLHFYDYRKALAAGASPDKDRHWPSEHKRLGHPNLIVEGRDTRTGKKAAPELGLQNVLTRASTIKREKVKRLRKAKSK